MILKESVKAMVLFFLKNMKFFFKSIYKDNAIPQTRQKLRVSYLNVCSLQMKMCSGKDVHKVT